MNSASSLRVAPANRVERRRERTPRELLAAAVEETIREGVASGAFSPVPPPIAAQAVVGMATQVLSWWTEQESLSIDTLQETMIGLALRGLGAQAPAGGAPRGGRSHGRRR